MSAGTTTNQDKPNDGGKAMSEKSHPKCQAAEGHVCQEPSGRVCIEHGCDDAAGTWWGPYWCPSHDAARLDGITASLESIAAGFAK